MNEAEKLLFHLSTLSTIMFDIITLEQCDDLEQRLQVAVSQHGCDSNLFNQLLAQIDQAITAARSSLN